MHSKSYQQIKELLLNGGIDCSNMNMENVQKLCEEHKDLLPEYLYAMVYEVITDILNSN